MVRDLLIDTSVWIDFFNGSETVQVKILCEYLENDDPLFVCPTIVQEVLQGIKNDQEYQLVKDCLFALHVLNDDAIEVAMGAVEIYRTMRMKGITIRKSNDCLIAYYARKYSLEILHHDRDFDKIEENY